MKKAKKRALSLRTLTVSMLMVILLAALAVFVSTNASSAVSDSDLTSGSDALALSEVPADLGEPKIIFTTNLSYGSSIYFKLNLSEIYADPGDGRIKKYQINSNSSYDFQTFGNTVKIYTTEEITEINCNHGHIAALDVSACTSLTSLECSNNSLTSLDISKNTELTSLYAPFNQLTELDISNNLKLEYLSIGNNYIGFTGLTRGENDIELTYIDKTFSDFPVQAGTPVDLSSEYNINGTITQYNWHKGGDEFTSVPPTSDLGNGVFIFGEEFIGKYVYCTLTNEQYPDFKVKTYFEIIAPITDYDTVLYTDKSVGDTIKFGIGNSRAYIDFGDGNPKWYDPVSTTGYTYYYTETLKGNAVKIYTDVYKLTCDDQQINAIDLSNNTTLKELDCLWNNLTSLDLSKCTTLERLSCYKNNLTKLDLSNCNALTYLDCDYNSLSSLLLPVDAPDFVSLSCSENNLTELNLTNSIVLTDLDIDNNQLSSIDVSKCTQISSLNVSCNKLTALDVSNLPNLKYLYLYENAVTSLDLTNNTNLITLKCNNNRLTELDISSCTALQNLNCEFNSIASLNLNNNTALKYIDCANNNISTLDVSNNTALKTLYCNNNYAIDNLTIDNPTLTYLDVSGNSLSLDISNAPALTTLDCEVCGLKTLDLSNNTELLCLYAGMNYFSSLDVSNNLKLKILNVEQSCLKEIDVSMLTELEEFVCSTNYLKFSTMKIGDNQISDFRWSRQFEIELPTYINPGETIDLSSEYEINGVKSVFTWYDLKDDFDLDNNKEITPTKSENGIFTFGEEFGGKTLYCHITNELYGDYYLDTTFLDVVSYAPCSHRKWEIRDYIGATCHQEGYSGDKYCLNCKRLISTGKSIPTIEHSFGPHELLDEEEHKLFCTMCGIETTEKHYGGTATYTEQAVCIVCGTSYGDLKAADVNFDTEALTLIVGNSKIITAYKYPENREDTITWTSSKDSVATVDANGEITAVAKGKAVITATLSNGNSASLQVTVVNQPRRETQSIVIKKSAVTLTIKRSKLNPTVSLSATIKGDSTGKSWYSDNINVATVNKSGKVTAVGDGVANIYCRTADGTVSEPCVVTVNSFCIDSDNITNNIIYVNVGEKCKVNLNNTSASGEITWKSSNEKTALIDADGNVTALKKGTVTITATAPDKSKDTCKLIVVVPSNEIAMNKWDESIYEGKTLKLNAWLTAPGSNDPIFWTSSDESVATVTAKGVVKGIKQGTARITAYTTNGNYINCDIAVISKAVTLEFTEVTPALYMGGSEGKFTVAITSPANSKDTITWSTSNKKVISIESVSADGKTITIKSGNKGTATITAKAGSGKKITYKVTSVNQAAESITLNKTSADIYVGKTVSLKASKILPRGCNDVVIWKSEDESIAAVTPDGKVTGISQGTVTIRANSFGGVTNEVTINVRTKATAIDIASNADTIQVGETATVSVSSISPAGCNDTIKWTTSSKVIATVEAVDNNTVKVTGLKKGTVTITAKTGSGKSKKIKIVVTQ